VNLGAESRNKVIALVALGAVALILVGRMFFSGVPTPAPVTTAPTATSPTPGATAKPPARGKASGKRNNAAAHSIDPMLRFDWLKASEDIKYEGNGRNIFLAQAEPPPTPLTNGATDKQKLAEQGPPPPPPPPPINLKFYGFASSPGEPKKVFLSQGEDLFVASEGEIVNRRYKVVHIMPMSVEIEDVLNNNRQSIPLTQG
jgi:hypothetical protein